MIKIEYVKINDLKPAEYNPRKLIKEQKEQLKKSIEKFGFVDPLIVNAAPGRENVIIGGHQRWMVAKEMGFETVPVIFVYIDDLEREKELNLRLNKNVGEWDFDLLASFDENLLVEVGFSAEEISNISFNDVEELFVDINKLQNEFSVVIKCISEDERNKVMQILGINKPRIKAKEFFEVMEVENE
jgi:ParB/RepB/Spo0J family partition protein